MTLNLKRLSHPALAMLETFPEDECVPEAVRPGYSKKRNALLQYRAGASHADIHAATGVSRQRIGQLLNRIVEPSAEDGKPMGHRALIAGRQADRSYAASTDSDGMAMPGALSALFGRYPTLLQAMQALVLEGKLPEKICIPSTHVTNAILVNTFWAECRALDIRDGEYPFVGDQKGAVAIKRWAKKIRHSHAQEMREKAAQRKLANEWYDQTIPSTRAYRRVECDGTHVEVNWKLRVPSIRPGSYQEIRAARIWLVSLIETSTSAILGWSVTPATNYSSATVLQAVRSALVPWKPRELNLCGRNYREGDCLPSGSDPRMAYVCWDEFAVDSALSNWSDMTLSTLESTVGCVVYVGPVDEPNVRPHIETMHSILLSAIEAVKKEDPKSVGKDRRNRTALRFDYQKLIDMIDLLIARYNNSKAPNCSETRNDMLRRLVITGRSLARRIPESLRPEIIKYDTFDTANITQDGGVWQVCWRNARYFGCALNDRRVHVGKEIRVMANSMDQREIKIALLEDGTALGVLKIEKRFNQVPHSEVTRQHTIKENRKNSFAIESADVPIAMHHRSAKHVEDGVRPAGSQTERREAAVRALERMNGDASEEDSFAVGSFEPDQEAASRLDNVVQLQSPNRRLGASVSPELLARIRKLGPTY